MANPFLSFKFRSGTIEGKLALDTVATELLAIPDEMRRKTVNEMSRVALEYIRDQVAEHTKTGVLALSLKEGQTPNKRGRQIYHDEEIAPYAKYVVNGFGRLGGKRSDNYPIVPVRAKSLFFFWAKIGKWVHRQKVMHPGYVGDDYFTAGYERAIIEFSDIINRVDPFGEK